MASKSRKESRKSSRRRPSTPREPVLRTPPAEELLEEYLSQHPFAGPAEPVVLCTSLGRGQTALALAGQIAGSHVTCCAFDCYLADEMQAFLDQYWIEDDEELDVADLDETGDEVASHNKVEVLCATDFPEVEADLVVIPVKKSGDAELARDWLQTGFLRLKTGGQLWTAVDHPRDHWLHDELKKYFPKVTRLPQKKGDVYIGTKTSEPKKIKNFWAEFEFRDGRVEGPESRVQGQRLRGSGTGDRGPVDLLARSASEGSSSDDFAKGRLIHGVSRPGVFSHRRVDGGARAIIAVMQIPPGARVADIGCGSGTVGFAAALRHPDVTVLAIDSNPRAIQCTEKGAELNGLTTVTTLLNADALCEPRGSFDVVVGNPPYYSNYRIAEIFLAGAYRALKPGGRVWMVTKQPHWFVERMSQIFDDVQEIASKGFKVIVGTQRAECGDEHYPPVWQRGADEDDEE